MIEKRYVLDDDGNFWDNGVEDMTDNCLNDKQIIDLLNENEELKRINLKLKKNLRRFYSKEEWDLKEVLGDFR